MPWAMIICLAISDCTLSHLPGIAPLPAVGFWVERAGTPVGTVGDQIPWQSGLALRWALPLDADVQILRNGRPFHQVAARSGTVDDIPEGVYRLEAYLTLVGERRPWVITNPVYVRPGNVEGNATGR